MCEQIIFLHHKPQVIAIVAEIVTAVNTRAYGGFASTPRVT